MTGEAPRMRLTRSQRDLLAAATLGPVLQCHGVYSVPCARRTPYTDRWWQARTVEPLLSAGYLARRAEDQGTLELTPAGRAAIGRE